LELLEGPTLVKVKEDELPFSVTIFRRKIDKGKFTKKL
jgi:hypothetical protein